ncbi:MAG: Xaa-Pro peptidase family protein [Acidimicrobiia bacterium]|nr:Xaa-Pro peptidase family protein [Acidimicrobiia bacterium]
MFEERMARVRTAMAAADVDVLLLSVGPDLPWLIGYEAMPLERLTMLVVPADAEASLVIPAFEVPRVVVRDELFTVRAWGETEDPVDIVAQLVGSASRAAIGDHTWSRFLVGLQRRLSSAAWVAAGEVTSPLRAVKDEAEIARLQAAASGVDRVAAALQSGEIPLVGRTEADVSAELSQRILAEGHAKVNFAIVASGANAASPHHHASDKVIGPGEVVLCDFGGTTAEPEGEPGYCSDITRCVYTGEPPAEFVEAYAALQDAQARSVAAAEAGTPAEAVDRVARDRLAEAGLATWFIHRLGHGIGVEAHEDPYLVDGNAEPLVAGNAFSIEPGFYVPDTWGARIEDIVIATAQGPVALNEVDHDLAVVDR